MAEERKHGPGKARAVVTGEDGLEEIEAQVEKELGLKPGSVSVIPLTAVDMRAIFNSGALQNLDLFKNFVAGRDPLDGGTPRAEPSAGAVAALAYFDALVLQAYAEGLEKHDGGFFPVAGDTEHLDKLRAAAEKAITAKDPQALRAFFNRGVAGGAEIFQAAAAELYSIFERPGHRCAGCARQWLEARAVRS